MEVGGGGGFVKPVFMHNPIRLLTVRGSSFVKNQRLPQPNPPKPAVYDLIPAGGLPESGRRCPIGPSSCWVFLVFVTEEVPIVLRGGSNLTFLCRTCIYTCKLIYVIFVLFNNICYICE